MSLFLAHWELIIFGAFALATLFLMLIGLAPRGGVWGELYRLAKIVAVDRGWLGRNEIYDWEVDARLLKGAGAIVMESYVPLEGECSEIPPDLPWEPTPETFVDRKTGRVVEVWFNPATHRKRYVFASTDDFSP